MNGHNSISLPRWRGEEPLNGKADGALGSLLKKTPGLDQMIGQVPLASTVAELSAYDPASGYHQLKPRLKSWHASLSSRFGEQLPMKYGLAVLSTLIQSHEERWLERPLDDELKPEFVDSFHRLLAAVSRGGVQALQLNTDAFAKELAICLHRLIPAGGQMVDPGSAVPKRTLLFAPPLQVVQGVYYVSRKAGGRTPFAELHTNIFMRHSFTPDGWEYCLQLLPSVFRSYPHLKGVMGASWFFDPALQSISPELHFVRGTAKRWGAVILRVGPDADPELGGALTMSKRRRELYQRGEYIPTVYAMILAKRDVLTRASRR